jgi:hypothetical protein
LESVIRKEKDRERLVRPSVHSAMLYKNSVSTSFSVIDTCGLL